MDIESLQQKVTSARNSGCAAMMQPLEVFQELIDILRAAEDELDKQIDTIESLGVRLLIADSALEDFKKSIEINAKLTTIREKLISRFGEEIDGLKAELKSYREQKPYGYLYDGSFVSNVGDASDYYNDNSLKLYALPAPQQSVDEPQCAVPDSVKKVCDAWQLYVQASETHNDKRDQLDALRITGCWSNKMDEEYRKLQETGDSYQNAVIAMRDEFTAMLAASPEVQS